MKTIIEINGRKYDARTGKLLETAKASGQPNHVAAKSGQIDGFSKHKPIASINNMPDKPKEYKPLTTANTSDHKSLDIKPAYRKVQKSKTLARSVVTKPLNKGPQVHATPAISGNNPEKSATGRGMLLKRVPVRRLERANKSIKSTFINRFERSSIVKPKLSENLEPVPEPTKDNQTAATPIIGTNHTAAKRQVFNHPNINYQSANHDNDNKTNWRTKISNHFSFNGKVVAITAAIFAIVLLGGFFAYQNVPSVGMRIAASKAGFNGKFPGSTPAGYAFKGPIEATKGNIVLTFASNSDERKFVVSQKPTSWTSESLLTNYLVDSKLRYQTYNDKGLTVYIYNESNATWVDKGIWYTVKGDGSLSSEQILEIASSI